MSCAKWQPFCLSLNVLSTKTSLLMFNQIHPNPEAANSIVALVHKVYGDVIMVAMASQITNLTTVYLIVYSGADQRKHQSSASLAIVRGKHR